MTQATMSRYNVNVCFSILTCVLSGCKMLSSPACIISTKPSLVAGIRHLRAIDMCARLSCRRDADRIALPHSSLVYLPGVTDNVVELVNETMAEAARSYEWQRVFPCSSDPDRYLDKFEMQRTDTKRVCQALKIWDNQRPQDVVVKTLSQSTSRAWR